MKKKFEKNHFGGVLGYFLGLFGLFPSIPAADFSHIKKGNDHLSRFSTKTQIEVETRHIHRPNLMNKKT